MRNSTLITLVISVSLAVLGTGVALSAQDKYSLKVPNGLPQANDAKCGFACHTIVKDKDFVFTNYAQR